MSNIKDTLEELKAVREFREVKAKRARLDLYKAIEKRRIKARVIVLAVLRKKFSKDDFLALEYRIKTRKNLDYSKELNWVLQEKTNDRDFITQEQIILASLSVREVARRTRIEVDAFKKSEKLRLKKKELQENIELHDTLNKEKTERYIKDSMIQKEINTARIRKNTLIKEIQKLESEVK